jgi:glucose-1-phosphate adenylyltransferase
LQAHCNTGSDVTIAVMKVDIGEAERFGVLGVDDSHRVVEFQEKQSSPTPIPGDPNHVLASMGISVFSLDLLSTVLREDHRQKGSSHDFGKDILPRLIMSHCIRAYMFGDKKGRVAVDRYWRDVGTLDAYYSANMDLLEPMPAINLYQPDWRIRTFETQSPPARTVVGESGSGAELIDSIICSGTIVAGGSIRHSVLSPNVRVEDRAVVEKSILFDRVTVGKGARLLNCIVDKDVSIPPGEAIGFDDAQDSRRFTVSDGGIVVIPKDYRFE